MINNFLGFKTIELPPTEKTHLLMCYSNKEHRSVILCGEEIPENTFLGNSQKPINCPHCLKILKLLNQ